MSLLRERGVVLRTYKLREADRIVVILTEGSGKVRAVAKGVRKTKSKFGSRLEPLSHVSLILWEGRSELDIVNQAELVESFPTMRQDLDRMTAAMSIVEITDQLTQERLADPRLYHMTVGALRSLDDPGITAAMVVPAFCFKALVADGAGPIVDQCANCDAPGPLVSFDLDSGGALCRNCRRGRSITDEGLTLLRRVLGGDLAAVLASPLGPGADEVRALATEAMETHLDRRLRSVRTASTL